MLLGYHLLWSRIANVVGNDEQADRFQKLIIENNYFVGGAVNPRDNDLKITYDDEKITYNGFKNFTTGAAVSDLIVLEGAIDGRPEEHIFTVVPTAQPGIVFDYNWDNIGLRLTESGSAKIQDVSAPWADALGWDAKSKKPDPAVLGIAFPTLLLPRYPVLCCSFRPVPRGGERLTPPQHPARLQQLLHRHRHRRARVRQAIHHHQDPAMAVQRRCECPFKKVAVITNRRRLC